MSSSSSNTTIVTLRHQRNALDALQSPSHWRHLRPDPRRTAITLLTNPLRTDAPGHQEPRAPRPF
ncbi:hypothetical protein BDW22DRAFT_1351501 [Trametopsis cervina]|nr:hypothetical protein BDW22DRAFT_1351501 [Trametopsis cervina]